METILALLDSLSQDLARENVILENIHSDVVTMSERLDRIERRKNSRAFTPKTLPTKANPSSSPRNAISQATNYPQNRDQGERLNLYLGEATRIAGELATGVCSHCSDPISLAVLANLGIKEVRPVSWRGDPDVEVMVPFRYKLFFTELLSLVESGEILMTRIDNNVERILRVKFVTGLFEHSFTDRSLIDLAGCKAHKDISCEIVRKSLVLLKNGKDPKKPFLPLDKTAKKILVAGTHADDLGYQCRGWTATWIALSDKITVASVGFAALLVPHGAVLRVFLHLIIEEPAIQPGHWV
ncbi:hypothetical protein CQW23_31858 [Capsicum baccatum]|uniref:Uncharacterized protein n=1 Tax=Capsicum baccatum TaxID=33114 RepID=A0A2G2V6C2_CAPBA|nr:hypothetical protein CQW23_31858 [Capsicum baccatum]